MSDSIRVLAVDDEDYMLKILKVCLKKPEFELETCSDAMSAMSRFKAGTFDIVLSDIVMPGIDGLELHSLIRGTNADIPIVMLTARVDDTNGLILKKISADKNTYYQNKNFTKEELINVITRIVDERRSLKLKSDYFKEMENNIALAGDVQMFMFPKWNSIRNGAQFSFFFLPYMKITGDIFAVKTMSPNVFLVLTGDISGHGVQSALFMSLVSYALERILRLNAGKKILPHEVLNELHSFLSGMAADRYMTCIVSIIDFNENKVTFQNAGHPDFIVFSPSSKKIYNPNPKKEGSLPVGMESTTVYTPAETVEYSIPEDAILFFCTDGLMDLQDKIGQTYKIDPIEEFVGTFAKDGLLPSTNFKIVDAIFKLGFNDICDDISIGAISRQVDDPNCKFFSMSPFLADIDPAVQAIASAVLEHTGNETLTAKVELIVSEFLNNIVIHGFGRKANSHQIVVINLRFKPDSLDIIFWDKAKEWDMYKNISNGESMSDILNLKGSGSGRGLSMIRQMTTSVLRNRFADTLNETTLSMKIE